MHLMHPSSCDTMVALGSVTAQGQTLFAKNSDRPADECQPLVFHPRHSHPPGTSLACQFVDMPQTATTWRHIGSRPYWCWGYEHGFNEHQVVIGNEALPSNLPTAQEAKLIGMELLRLGLERGRSAAQAVEVITGLVSRYGQGKFANEAGVRTYDNGYIVADPQEAFVVETAGHGWAVRRVERAVGISNVYSIGVEWDAKSPDAPIDFGGSYADPTSLQGSGAIRRARSCALLERPSQPLAAPDLMAILSDHGDAASAIPEEPSICMHSLPDGTRGNTAASLVADLCADGSRLPVYWCSFYSPCLGLFLPIFLEGALPSVLSVGGQTPSAESPWWGFHRLSQLARCEPDSRMGWVRSRWQPLQASLLASAYPLAQKAKKLLDGGEEATARRLLSDYMAENTRQMLGELKRMLAELDQMESRLPARKEPALATAG
jgi:secernin